MDEFIENSTDVICVDCLDEDIIPTATLDHDDITNQDITHKIVPGVFLILIAVR